jgi:hypothetical protein
MDTTTDQRTPTVRLDRLYHDEYQTRGIISYKQHAWRTLELPWRDNEQNISCIPPAPEKRLSMYPLRHRDAHESPKNDYDHFQVEDVNGRSYILVEIGNLYEQTRGCIFVGNRWIDINRDGIPDVSDSATALAEMRDVIPPHAQLVVQWTLMPRWLQHVVGAPPKDLPTPPIDALLNNDAPK